MASIDVLFIEDEVLLQQFAGAALSMRILTVTGSEQPTQPTPKPVKK